jgi:hypothetical protein
MSLPITKESRPRLEPEPLPLVAGETYRHVPTAEVVEVVDFEYWKHPDTPNDESARTGRALVRPKDAPWDVFLAFPADLRPLDLPPQFNSTLIIPGAQMLDDKDFPQLDDKTRVRTRPQPAPNAPPVLGLLRVTRCPDVTQVGRVWPVRGEATLIGRDPDNHISINDADVSRHHARIDAREALLTLTDTDSTNGTIVNGQKVKESPLRVGDTILVGSTALVFAAP